jgi:hypothetical protein
MSNKFSTMALGTLLGLSTLAFPGSSSASAAAMLPLAPIVSGEANSASEGIVQVKHKKNHNWDNNRQWNKRYGKRCNSYNDNCRHRYRGRYYETPWWTLPVIIGGGIAANNYYNNNDYDDYDYDYDDGGGMSSRHVQWCLNRYQSYNPRNNTWLAYSGNINQCNSPYT